MFALLSPEVPPSAAFSPFPACKRQFSMEIGVLTGNWSKRMCPGTLVLVGCKVVL